MPDTARLDIDERHVEASSHPSNINARSIEPRGKASLNPAPPARKGVARASALRGPRRADTSTLTDDSPASDDHELLEADGAITTASSGVASVRGVGASATGNRPLHKCCAEW